MLEFLRDYFFYIWNLIFRRSEPEPVASAPSEADGSCVQPVDDTKIRFESPDADTSLKAPQSEDFSLKGKSAKDVSATDKPVEPKSGTLLPQTQTFENNLPKYDPKPSPKLETREPLPPAKPEIKPENRPEPEIVRNPEEEAFGIEEDELDDIDKEILDYEEELLHKEIEEENLRRKFCTKLDKDSFDSEEELLHKEIEEENSRRKINAGISKSISDQEEELNRKQLDEEDLHKKVREHLKALQEQENYAFQPPPQSKIPQPVSRPTSENTHPHQPSSQQPKLPEPISKPSPNTVSLESQEKELFSKSNSKPALKHSPRVTEYESDEEVVTQSDDEIDLEDNSEQTHQFLNDLTK